MSQNLLITGATGKQGGAVIKALLASPHAQALTILALTRNPTSTSATTLAQKAPNIILLKGDLNDCPAIFASAAVPISAVFSVQLPFGSGATPATEEKQGKALIDAALAHGVQHFVYASVERHGDDADTDPTDVPHFVIKYNIEKHLEARTDRGARMSYTVLRPVAFMENVSPDFMGRMFVTMVKTSLSPGHKIQLVSTADVGYFGAEALVRPDDARYRNVAIDLAGDELTFEEMSEVFGRVVGGRIPTTFALLGQGLMWMMADLGIMFRWINAVGFNTDIGKVKEMHPKAMTFADWLAEKENGWVKG